jgi:hypothetical protein
VYHLLLPYGKLSDLYGFFFPKMLFFSKPVNKDRFNATLHELIRMRYVGDVHVEGWWDAHDALSYLEQRLRLEIIPTFRSDGTFFYINYKYILFLETGVLVSTWNLLQRGDVMSCAD